MPRMGGVVLSAISRGGGNIRAHCLVLLVVFVIATIGCTSHTALSVTNARITGRLRLDTISVNCVFSTFN